MSRRVHLIVGGGFTYLISVGAGYLYANSVERNDTVSLSYDLKLSDQERHKTYSSLAPRYDSDIGLDEILMGLTLIRWWHLSKSDGDVLEVGMKYWIKAGYTT